ncbi:hypothetical protein JYU34_004390 [Plutella xylostella]|uniref:Uncharacterized protein n=1 Tax=Plutella xylostella TaxID=51655 RepID=A0ABQ7QXX5_PLUXY|nr:hypothetical protein JYU34_004390 [Plutella xylostella]
MIVVVVVADNFILDGEHGGFAGPLVDADAAPSRLHRAASVMDESVAVLKN